MGRAVKTYSLLCFPVNLPGVMLKSPLVYWQRGGGEVVFHNHKQERTMTCILQTATIAFIRLSILSISPFWRFSVHFS